MTIDIFCHVIDYFGDVAVSYRLARALKRLDPSLQIRFFCSHPELIQTLYPHHKHDTVALFDYVPTSTLPYIADVAIEAFACTLPVSYQKPKLIINLEYLTAETWIESYHKQESIGMNPNGKKFFFFPSFSASGSLTHGEFLDYLLHQQTHSIKEHLIQTLDLPTSFVHRPWLLVYLYDITETTIQNLLEHFSVIVIGDHPPYHHPSLVARRCSQETFDHLIIASNRSLIRGEDSLSRAILAGKPFLWQAYKQEDDYHLVKVEALSQHLEALVYDTNALLIWKNLQLEINQNGTFNVHQFINLPNMIFGTIARSMRNLPSLELNLHHFMEECLLKLR